MRKWVYLFTEGDATMRELLGGKGANLAEMTGLGLPVPAQVARQAGCAPNTMTKRLGRLRESLRRTLEQEGISI